MKVHSYLILLIVGCCLCAAVVFCALNWIQHGKEVVIDKVNQGALTMRDVKSLERSFSQWMLLNDLLLGSDESHLCQGCTRLGEEIDEMLLKIQEDLPPQSDNATSELRTFVERQLKRIQRSASRLNSDREKELYKLLIAMDGETEVAITALEDLGIEVYLQHENDVALLNNLLKNNKWKNYALMAGFLFCVSLLWLWISEILSRPIFRLAEEASSGFSETRKFKPGKNDPIEVQRLAIAFADLVNNLEFQIAAHRKSQIDREKLHSELVTASRMAGMA